MTAALIVVDVQNDFTHPEGNLYVAGSAGVIEAVNTLLPYYESVVFTKDYHPEETSHFAEHGGDWPNHCVRGTWGAEFHEGLNLPERPIVVHKGIFENEDGYSGFTVEVNGEHESTELDELLQDLKVDAVTIVGIALDVCVKATALDAVQLGYYTTVLHYATAPVTEAGGREAVHELRSHGVTI